jgi:hypothetical protein
MNMMSRCEMNVRVFDEDEYSCALFRIKKEMEEQDIAEEIRGSECDNVMRFRQQDFGILITKTIEMILKL